jgi:hypothetical protein
MLNTTMKCEQYTSDIRKIINQNDSYSRMKWNINGLIRHPLNDSVMGAEGGKNTGGKSGLISRSVIE